MTPNTLPRIGAGFLWPTLIELATYTGPEQLGISTRSA